MKSFKTKMKLLTAAVAIAVAAPAGAAITFGGPSSTPDELFLSVWSTTLNLSYTRDLGLAIGNFTPTAGSEPVNGQTVAWNNATFSGSAPTNGAPAGSILTPGYLLTFAADSRLTGALLGASDTVWNVGAVGKSTAPQSQRLILTTVDAATEGNITGNTTSQLINSQTNAAGYLGAVNPLPAAQSSHGTQTNGSNTAVPADSQAFAPTTYGADWGNAFSLSSFNTAAGVSNALLFDLVQGGPTAFAFITRSSYTGATWKLNGDGTLVYNVAAVPEPGTWAMLAAGLVMVGGIARRRMSA